MITITFIICLTAAAPPRCQHKEMTWHGSMQTCMLRGQHEIAGWLAERPEWRLAGGWQCLSGRRV